MIAHHVLDVAALMEANQVVVALDLYGKEISHLTLILYLPSFLKLVRELPVERVLVVVLQYGNKSLALLAVLPFGYQIFSVNLVLLKELLNILWAPFALVQELDQAKLDFA